MEKPSLVEDTASIVVRGNFNPAIFSPGFLLAHDLIGAKEAEDARPEAIVPNLSVFEVAWLRCEVTPDRLRVATTEPEEFDRLRDLAVGILSILGQTPVLLLGLNRSFHFELASFDDWHRLGDALAPKDIWDGPLRLPGMRAVSIQGARRDSWAGYIQVRVEPSTRCSPGIFIDHNDHYVLEHVDAQPETRQDTPESQLPDVSPSAERVPRAIDIMRGGWNQSLAAAEEIYRAVFGVIA